MNAVFGTYDPSVDYRTRNGSYLFFVNNRFLVPIVHSNYGWFLIGGGIEENESELECLKREVFEEIGGEIEEETLVCETETFFYSDEYDAMYRSCNHFFFANKLFFSTSSHEDLELHWLTFSDAICRLTLEHQKWALTYFRKNIGDFIHDEIRMDSMKFIQALEGSDLDLLKSVPKSDLHFHSVYGSTQEVFEKYTGEKIESILEPFESFHEFRCWCKKQVSKKFKSKEGFLIRLKTALISAQIEHIDYLCFNVAACSMQFFDSELELISEIEKLRCNHFFGSIFIPELCLDRNKTSDKQYINWAWTLIKTGYFRALDVTGDENISIDELMPFYKFAKGSNMLLKGHFAEYGEPNNSLYDVLRLGILQVQHGNMFAFDDEIVERIKMFGLQLNLCPSSNFFLSRIDSFKKHPIKELYRRGVKVTINSDDPLIFGTSISQEYLKLYEEHVLNAEELNQIRLNGLNGYMYDSYT